MAIPCGNASIICGASYHIWILPSVIICADVAKDPSDRLSPLTSAKSYISESRYLARYFPANIPWPMTNIREKNKCVVYDYKVGDKVLICKDSILRKAESIWKKEPWTITTVHTKGTIRIQCGTKSERINIWRVTPFSEELLI